MKKMLFTMLFAITICGYSQQKLDLTKEGVAPVVTDVVGKTAEELFSKTKEWVQVTYKDPKEVLKAEIANDMIRIQGFSKSFFINDSFMKYEYDVLYSVEFGFKEGKYRFSFVAEKITQKGQEIPFLKFPTDFYKSDGRERSSYKSAITSFEKSLNDLYVSHYDYVTGKTNSAKSDW